MCRNRKINKQALKLLYRERILNHQTGRGNRNVPQLYSGSAGLKCRVRVYTGGADKSLARSGRKPATSMSIFSWMMDPTRSCEMPSYSAIYLAEIRRSSKINSWIWSIISGVVGLRTYQHLGTDGFLLWFIEWLTTAFPIHHSNFALTISSVVFQTLATSLQMKGTQTHNRFHYIPDNSGHEIRFPEFINLQKFREWLSKI